MMDSTGKRIKFNKLKVMCKQHAIHCSKQHFLDVNNTFFFRALCVMDVSNIHC